jgi:hypothetical protein
LKAISTPVYTEYQITLPFTTTRSGTVGHNDLSFISLGKKSISLLHQNLPLLKTLIHHLGEPDVLKGHSQTNLLPAHSSDPKEGRKKF